LPSYKNQTVDLKILTPFIKHKNTMPAPTQLSAQYHITHSVWRHDYKISGSHTFHVDNSAIRPGKPDLTFHAGPDTNAPVAGACKFRHFSSDTEIGLGDGRSGISWERMSRESLRKVQYAFRMDLKDRPHRFTWKKTSSLGGSHSGNLKLVEDSGKVVAVFSAGGSFSMKTGQLDVYANYGERFSLMVLITGIALREKLRRTNNAASSAGAGAGAGAGGGC
jgi:hypothetical protein